MSDIDAARDYIHDAQAALDRALEALDGELPGPEPEAPIVVPAGQSVQAALDAAPAGATLQLEAATYPGSVIYRKPVTVISAVVLAPGRVTPGAIGSWIVGDWGTDAMTVVADDVTLIGIGAKSLDASHQLLAVTGARFTGKQIALLGSPTEGQHRGLMPHGDTGSLSDSFIDECWRVGQDAQAICGWQDGKHWVFTNNYLGGGAEVVMFGGADAPSADRIPQDMTFTGNTLSKNMAAWMDRNAQLKNGLELKCCDGFIFEDNIVEYAGPAQSGYVLLLKSCNQDGSAPWSVVQNVRIERNLFRCGGGGASFVGQDGSNPAVRMNHVTLTNNCFECDPTTAPGGGDGRGFIFQSGVDHLTIDGNTLDGKNLATEMYFIAPPPTAMVLRNIKGILPQTSAYGVKIDAGGSGLAAVQAWAPDAVIEITAEDAGAVGYPVG